jgi:hypothetical protein
MHRTRTPHQAKEVDAVTFRFGRRIIRFQRKWPFVVTWKTPPSYGWFHRHFIEDISYADKKNRH